MVRNVTEKVMVRNNGAALVQPEGDGSGVHMWMCIRG